jgi:TnpA family transposase
MQRISRVIDDFPEDIINKIENLISSNEGILSLNDVRYDQCDFSYTEIAEETTKVKNLASIYQFCKKQIPILGLSQNAVRYYSSNVEQYPIARLRKLSKLQSILYTLCYIYCRYQTFIDNLITSFMHYAVLFIDKSKDHGEKEFAAHAAKIVKSYPKVSKFFRWFTGYEDKRFVKKKYYKEAYEIIEKENFEKFAKFFERSDFNLKMATWDCIETFSRSIALYLRSVVLAVNFEHYLPKDPSMALIRVLKDYYLAGKSPSKLKISEATSLPIPKSMIPYLKSKSDDQYLNPHRLEFFVYKKLYHHLDRGRIFCNDSVSYRDIDADLVPEDMLDKADKIAQQYGYHKIPIYCSTHLDQKLLELNNKWKAFTHNIKNNKVITIITNKDGSLSWQLNYETSEKLDNSFYHNVSKSDIADILAFVNDTWNIFEGFTHIKGRYIKKIKPNIIILIACLLAEAFGFGTKKMFEMSDLSFNALRSTKEDYFSYESFCIVNDMLADEISELEIFKEWNLLDDKLLADIDGQKSATKSNTIQSRYSKKYLGKGKGLSILSMIANFVAVAVKNIGLNEYEGHHLYDMIYDNKSDIKVDAVTGDNHTLNQLNFIALDAINVEFVPSIKNIKKAAEDLYSVDDISNYSGIIKPTDRIKVNRIKKQEKQIIRVLLSLILQENTQSTIIRKLNSHARYAGLRAGLMEYNKIFKTLHVLNMIENMPLRKAIRTARNRTEAYHQLQNLIRKMYYGVYKGKRIVDHRISTQAVRLLSNLIIGYNAIILNNIYLQSIKSKQTTEDLNNLLRISPMSWIHIAFTGRYTFKNGTKKIDLSEIIDILSKELKARKRKGYKSHNS